MERPDTEFDLTVREVLVREQATDEMDTAWRVTAEHMDLPCAGDTAAEALRVLAGCLELDDDEDEATVTIEQLAGE